MHLYRWACQLQMLETGESPQKVLEAVAPSWKQLYQQILLEKILKVEKHIVSSLNNKSKLTEKRGMYETFWKRNQLEKFLLALHPQRLSQG